MRQCDASTLRNGNTAIQKKEAPLLEASFKLFSIWRNIYPLIHAIYYVDTVEIVEIEKQYKQECV